MKPKADDHIGRDPEWGYWIERGETRDRLAPEVFRALRSAGRLQKFESDHSTAEWIVLPEKEGGP